LRYKLIGKIEHTGTMNGGHYWAHSFRAGSWWKINDANLAPSNAESSENTFIVAYHMY
jgi:ubiquitin C-terminal hydrolase